MNLTNKQLTRIIKEEIDNVILENINLKQLISRMEKQLSNISRVDQERGKAFLRMIPLIQKASPYSQKSNLDDIIDILYKRINLPQYKIGSDAEKIIKDFSLFFLKSQQGPPSEELLKNFKNYGIDLITSEHSFFKPKEKATNKASGGKEPSADGEAPEKTPDTDKLLNVIDQVNDEWDSIANSTNDKNLKSAMDYVEKIALAELKKS